MGKRILLFLFLITVNIFGKNNKEPVDNKKLSIYTSVIPIKYLVDRIGGDFVSCNFLVGPGKNPETYQPTPRQIMGLSKANILFIIDVPFEKAYLSKIIKTLPNLTVINCSDGVKKRSILNNPTNIKPNSNESLDPHIWLSPVLGKIISNTILKSLIAKNPSLGDYFLDRYNILIEDLTKVTEDIHGILKPFTGRKLLVYHPSFGYFTNEFGLNQVAIETGGKEPSLGQLNKIINTAIRDEIQFVVVQPNFSKKNATTVATGINGHILILNPLAHNYLENLMFIGKEIERAYKNN